MTRAVFACVIVAALTACDFVLFERQMIVDGQFRGLAVGSSKEDVLQGIRKLNVFAVRPAPSINFRATKRNIEDLEKAKQVEGIRLTGKPGIAIDLFFKDEKIWRVRKSVPAQSLTWFADGMDRAVVLAKIKELLQEDSDWEVFPIVFYEGNGWIVIEKTLDEARRTVLPHNAWNFELSSDKPAGAFVTVYFHNDRLAKIEYRRPRVRLD